MRISLEMLILNLGQKWLPGWCRQQQRWSLGEGQGFFVLGIWFAVLISYGCHYTIPKTRWKRWKRTETFSLPNQQAGSPHEVAVGSFRGPWEGIFPCLSASFQWWWAVLCSSACGHITSVSTATFSCLSSVFTWAPSCYGVETSVTSS